MLFSILTGFVAGAVHVVSGADHLVAMAPTAFRKPRLALKSGLAWGVGHSAGVLLLSFAAREDFRKVANFHAWSSNNPIRYQSEFPRANELLSIYLPRFEALHRS